MAIEKGCSFKVSKIDSSLSKEIMTTEEDELLQNSLAVDSDNDDDEEEDEFDDVDSAAGSDDFDVLELGKTGSEFCRIGDSTCSIPLELYELPGLENILSVKVWNDCLSEEERFRLTKYLPDMEQDAFMRTLNELFNGSNFHFGSPVAMLFDLLKGGLSEPRVVLYREGLSFFQKHQHYHFLRERQNGMVSSLRELRDAWRKCKGYSIEERLRVLNITRGQMSLMNDYIEDVEFGSRFPGLGRNSEPYSSAGSFPRHNYDPGAAFRTRERMMLDYEDDGVQWMEKSPFLESGKKSDLRRSKKAIANSFMGFRDSGINRYAKCGKIDGKMQKRSSFPSSVMESSYHDEVEALEGILQFSKKIKSVRRDSIDAEGILHSNKTEHPRGTENYHPKAKQRGKMQKRSPFLEDGSFLHGYHDRFEDPLLGLISVMKKRKWKEYTSNVDGKDDSGYPQLWQQPNEPTLSKKVQKRRDEDRFEDMEAVELHGKEMGRMDVDIEIKPQKKAFTLITPTVHTGFSFSIMHLLSAVRLALVSKPKEDRDGKQECGVDLSVQTNPHTLTVREIIERVKSKPGDPCILETQEPLQDLIRGALRILSSKTAPLGAKGWKTLVQYEKPTKTWSWIGPAPAPHDPVELVASPEAWGLPHRMLVKLVDSFANWLKNGQVTLQQLGTLPEPPLASMFVTLDEKERFKDLKAQKSLNTINPSSSEVKAYFRKEELLRYCIPDRAFSYTATDGKKSTVAPLRRCLGKPNSKARDHFMLKDDRPPHVTVLCLVRDAAARLPGSIGTRADVCTLIRDSQYIVEKITDAQLNQVVSGALDRLHYERDPCVQFQSDRKLWVYLHREREEEDFEDDGTSSTKKWKRNKKVSADQEEGAVTVAPPDNEDQPRPDSRQNGEDNVVMCLGNEIQWLSSVVA